MTQFIDLRKYADLTELSQDQILKIEGGGIWGDIAFLLGATAHSFWQFSKQTMEYQNSLSPILKK